MANEKLMYEQSLMARKNAGFNLMLTRAGVVLQPDAVSQPELEGHSIDGINDTAHLLNQRGGFAQQSRMIKDKRKTLDKAVLYSYQGAQVKKVGLEDAIEPARALINSNKLKPDYDDKILSIGYEHDFKPGDVFEWLGTDTHWLIYLQDLTELAYFRGDIRKCSYQIEWMDEDGVKSTYAAISGPTETRIEFLQKYGNSYDVPNYSLNIYIPKNPDTLKYFKRYARFYLHNGLEQICWRIEAVDSYSMPGIIQFTAVEYYADKARDNVEDGIANMTKLVEESIKERQSKELNYIDGEVFIKPKATKQYVFRGSSFGKGSWTVEEKYPVTLRPYFNNKNQSCVEIKWTDMYSGQFDLTFTAGNGAVYTKTIVVESLF